jgi:hypothetical protein
VGGGGRGVKATERDRQVDTHTERGDRGENAIFLPGWTTAGNEVSPGSLHSALTGKAGPLLFHAAQHPTLGKLSTTAKIRSVHNEDRERKNR